MFLTDSASAATGAANASIDASRTVERICWNGIMFPLAGGVWIDRCPLTAPVDLHVTHWHTATGGHTSLFRMHGRFLGRMAAIRSGPERGWPFSRCGSQTIRMIPFN